MGRETTVPPSLTQNTLLQWLKPASAARPRGNKNLEELKELKRPPSASSSSGPILTMPSRPLLNSPGSIICEDPWLLPRFRSVPESGSCGTHSHRDVLLGTQHAGGHIVAVHTCCLHWVCNTCRAHRGQGLPGVGYADPPSFIIKLECWSRGVAAC